MVDTASAIALVLAVITNGLLAGLFFVFSCAISPGFRRIDDGECVNAFRAINTTILNRWFLSIFFVAPLAAVVGAVLHIVQDAAALISVLLAMGAGCSVLTFAITSSRNVPLNQGLDRAPTDTARDLRAARLAFEEPWHRWNLARTLTSFAALTLLTVAGIMSP